MLIELLSILLIFLFVIIFILIFRPLDVHVSFQNDNLSYFLKVSIKLLLLNLMVHTVEDDNSLIIKIQIFSRQLFSFSYDFKSESENEKDENTIEVDVIDESEVDETDESYEKSFFENTKKFCNLLLDSKNDLYDLIGLSMKIIEFKNSNLFVNLGLQDNNLTIKTCTFLWALFAPLYPLNLRLILTPEINKFLLKTDMNLYMKIHVLNVIKIIIKIVRTESLRNMVKFFM